MLQALGARAIMRGCDTSCRRSLHTEYIPMTINILLLIRITALVLGAAAAGVGCFAAYEAAAKADGGYLMVAAPVVALAAALGPACFDRALRDRQWLRGIVLFIVWVPCALTVFYTAAERVHLAKAGG